MVEFSSSELASEKNTTPSRSEVDDLLETAENAINRQIAQVQQEYAETICCWERKLVPVARHIMREHPEFEQREALQEARDILEEAKRTQHKVMESTASALKALLFDRKQRILAYEYHKK